jgi:hypothetical protein
MQSQRKLELAAFERALSRGRGVKARLHIIIAVQEHPIIGDRFFEELIDEKEFRTVNDRMDAVLERLHGREGLEGFADENEGGVATLAHGHPLQRLERQVFIKSVRGEAFLDDHNVISYLTKAHEKVAVCGGGVNLVAELLERFLDLFQPFRRRESEQCGFIRSADEFKLFAHVTLNYLILSVATGAGVALPAISTIPFMRSEPMFVVISPRALRMLSIPRVTVPRLVQ